MTEEDLRINGFKKEEFGGSFWYELKMGKHKFLTNDTTYNKGKDRWHIGYECEPNVDTFWFNSKLTNMGDFKIIFRLLTGMEFKLAHQRDKITTYK